MMLQAFMCVWTIQRQPYHHSFANRFAAFGQAYGVAAMMAALVAVVVDDPNSQTSKIFFNLIFFLLVISYVATEFLVQVKVVEHTLPRLQSAKLHGLKVGGHHPFDPQYVQKYNVDEDIDMTDEQKEEHKSRSSSHLRGGGGHGHSHGDSDPGLDDMNMDGL